MAKTTQTYLLADGSAELERLTLQARVWEPEWEAIAEGSHLWSRWSQHRKAQARNGLVVGIGEGMEPA